MSIDIPVAPLELDDTCTCWRDDGERCPVHDCTPLEIPIHRQRCIDYEQRFGQITEDSRQCRAYGTDCPDCGATYCSEHMRVHDCPESITAVAVTVFREMLEAHNQFMLDNLFGIRKAGHV